MKSRLRRACSDAFASAGVLAFVLAVLISIDVRVREQLRATFPAASPSELAGIGTQLREVTSVVYDAARTQSIEHAPMLIFVVAGTVLLLCMLRA